jgi:hypothetical protein
METHSWYRLSIPIKHVIRAPSPAHRREPVQLDGHRPFDFRLRRPKGTKKIAGSHVTGTEADASSASDSNDDDGDEDEGDWLDDAFVQHKGDFGMLCVGEYWEVVKIGHRAAVQPLQREVLRMDANLEVKYVHGLVPKEDLSEDSDALGKH